MPRSSKFGGTHRRPSTTIFEIFDKPTHTISFRDGLVEEDHVGKGRLV